MNYITTQKANCTDCHRCVRYCPVKAIGVYQSQARVIDEKCILCGQCVLQCPQHAKQIVTHLDGIRDLVKGSYPVILSLAPSFAASFKEFTSQQLFLEIQTLGFTQVEETAVGAELISARYVALTRKNEKTVISACCPVVVNLISRYFPELLPNIANIVSPMIAHAKLIKKNYGEEIKVVFAGPCIAKLEEADHTNGLISGILTFEQLRLWLQESKGKITKNVKPENHPGRGRFFPITGGIIKSFRDSEMTDLDFITVDGIENCIETFQALKDGQITPKFIEALACPGGCINGPVNACNDGKAAKRERVIRHAEQGQKKMNSLPFEVLAKQYNARTVALPEPTEMELAAILQKTGKFHKEDEKNCGACGYNTCREKAIAVFQGLAETEMCVPYMRAKAESFANIIVQHSLNGIIVFDKNFVIQDINPAAQAMLHMEQRSGKGRNLREIIDCMHFEEFMGSENDWSVERVEYADYGLVTEQMILPVPQHDVVILILTDITDQEIKQREMERMKEETMQKVSQVIDKQMKVAQEIASLMGETTAETKSALLEVTWLLQGKGV